MREKLSVRTGLPSLAALVCAVWASACGAPVDRPAPPSAAYEDTVRAFYQGLAAFDVTLLEDAETSFRRAAALSPDEPAIRANLAVAYVGLGNDEAATVELEAARMLAPESSEIAFLQGQLASFRGRFDEAEGFFRETLAREPDHLMGRFALAQALQRSEDEAQWLEAQQLFASIADEGQINLAVLVEYVRVAARRADAPAVAATIETLRGVSDRWPEVAITQLTIMSEAVGTGDFSGAATRAQLLRNVLVRLPSFRKDLAAVSVSAELVAEPIRRFMRLPPPAATAAPRDDTLVYTPESLASSASGPQEIVAIVPPSGGGDPVLVVAEDPERPVVRASSPDGFLASGADQRSCEVFRQDHTGGDGGRSVDRVRPGRSVVAIPPVRAPRSRGPVDSVLVIGAGGPRWSVAPPSSPIETSNMPTSSGVSFAVARRRDPFLDLDFAVLPRGATRGSRVTVNR